MRCDAMRCIARIWTQQGKLTSASIDVAQGESAMVRRASVAEGQLRGGALGVHERPEGSGRWDAACYQAAVGAFGEPGTQSIIRRASRAGW